MDRHNYHYSREFYDRYAQSQEKSVVNKMQQKYWKTKQTLIKVTGKKEDEHVVASDSDLDAKLELRLSTTRLLMLLPQLSDHDDSDRTSSELCRLVRRTDILWADSKQLFHSIQRTCMELLKVIEQYQKRICFLSQEENELGKFLRSQGSQDKTRAGKIMQATGKALCFSSQQRLSLRSPLARLYQEVETFRYRAISDSWLTVNRMEQSRTEYRGVLLWMKDVSQELDPDTYKQMEKFRKVQAQVRHTKAAFDRLKTDVCEKVDLLRASRCNLLSHVLTTYQTTLLHFWEKTSHTMAAIHESFKGYQPYEFTTLKTLQDPVDKLMEQNKKKTKVKEEASTEGTDQLISLDDIQQNDEPESPAELDKENLPSFDSKLILDENTDDLLDLKPEEKILYEESAMSKDPLDPDSGEKDEMQLLNEILSVSSLESCDLGKKWTAVFGEPLSTVHLMSPTATETTAVQQVPSADSSSVFLPSQLLDQDMNDLLFSMQGMTANSGISPPPSLPSPSSSNFNSNINKTPPKDGSKNTKDLSAWYNLFADLDPLSNPDAVGKTDKEHESLNA